jgi:Polyketide cyclase / dehydrase and lipid transport
MAKVRFEVQHSFHASPARVWDEMVDWSRHGAWIPMTRVAVAPGDQHAVGATFTAWTGVGRLALEDRMRVSSFDWDDQAQRGACAVDKLGPLLIGTAAFTVEAGRDGGTDVNWKEDVGVPRLPQFLAPILAAAGAAGFRFGMRRLARIVET